MTYSILFQEVIYPKGYKAGIDNYNVKTLAKAVFTDYSRSKFKTLEDLIWSKAALKKVTSKVTHFRVFEYGSKIPFFTGSI